MNVPILKIIIIALLCSMSSGCVKASPPITGNYEKIDRPTVQQIDLTADRIQASAFRSDPKIDCHFLQPDFCVAIGIDRDRNDYRTSEAGLRAFLVEKTNKSFKVHDRSHGSKGAYHLTPTFYYNAKDESWVILAEYGYEYSAGTRVFIFRDKMLTDVGTLNVAFQGKFGMSKTRTTPILNEVSIVPYTVISTVNNSLVFSFTQDVEHDPGGKGQRTIAKERIRYIYSQDKLQEVIDPEKNTALPDVQ
jgi:hypothetical protein